MIPSEDCVFFDESGMNNNERQAYGWGKKGNRVYDEKPGFPSTRMSILAGLHQRSLCSPFIFDGYCNRELVERYFEEILLPEVGPGKTIILDNASFHKKGKIKTIVESASCQLLYLPAYSPDLNPIEHHWFAVKNSIRAQLPSTNYNLWDAAIAPVAKSYTVALTI